jgi:hypothetical protein
LFNAESGSFGRDYGRREDPYDRFGDSFMRRYEREEFRDNKPVTKFAWNMLKVRRMPLAIA